MNKIKYLLIILLSSTLLANTNIIEKNGLKYFADVVIVKFKAEQSVLNKGSLSKTLSKQYKSFGVSEIVKYFNPKDKNEENSLNNIYRLKLSSPYDPIYVASKLSKLADVEWAEPKYLRTISHTPNDPKLSSQYGLAKVQAEAAWDISKGNSNIIIAIIDSGVDWNHEDLGANIWQNDDPINGIDDDQNGYIDDIRGWDFGGLNGTPDNNPVEDSPTHGTHVAGIAAAVTNNSIGIAGLGYNLTIMPVKTTRHDLDDRTIAYGYEGIIYAAENGANIINCSWGGFGYSHAEQEAIDYAVSKGSVLVCAAGNEGVNGVIFPAAYNGVLSVGNTDQSDIKSFSSNYGKDLDVCAPGSGIYSTWQSNTYTYLSGTSMASPLAAGLAGLVIDKFPNYTPLQVIEQIRVNADNIDALNPTKVNLLGSGRINAYKALSNNNSKSVRIVNSKFTETVNPDGLLQRGEEVAITINFMNYLNSISSFTADLTTTSSDVTITNSHFAAPAKGTLEGFNNSKEPFKFTINGNSADDKEILFKLTYLDGDYSDFQIISVIINPTYITQVGKNIAITITSKGNFGFNDYPNNQRGDGFSYMQGGNLLFESGLMYGISESQMVNTVRNTDPDLQDNDFNPIHNTQLIIPGNTSDVDGYSVFNDDNAGTSKLGIETTLKTYSFSDNGNDGYIILKYLFKNNSGVDYSNFYSGIFFDWDIDENTYGGNVTKYDSLNNFGIVYNTPEEQPYIGMALLTNGSTNFYGIANDGLDDGFGVYEGFTDASKWLAMTNGLNKTNAGPNDISCVISAGPFEIKADSTLVVSFSINAAMDLSSLQSSVINSRAKYISVLTDIDIDDIELPLEFSLSQNYPNPFNPSTTINYTIPRNTEYYSVQHTALKIYDILGREVATLVSKQQSAGNYEVTFDAKNLTSGIYFYKLTSGEFIATKKLMLLK
ncbi:MAG: S8 family peptidase [Bacteroidetes bacterium]|nr:S8 family peptidase [Bacteroidota bacterium]